MLSRVNIMPGSCNRVVFVVDLNVTAPLPNITHYGLSASNGLS